MSKLLINENPLIVLPSLVKEMDGNITKAMLLQQINFLLLQPRSGIDHDGHHWIWKTAEEWVEDYFFWLEPDTLRRHLVSLEKDGHIVSTQRIRDKWDATKYYRLSDRWSRNAESNRDSNPTSSEDSNPTSSEDSNPGSYTEITTENTSHTTEKTTTTNGGGDDVESDGGGATLAQVNKAYENEIGMFTAMMSETVGDDFDTYGGDWLIDAIKIAANSNKRSWRYVQGILRRWSIEGRGDLDAKADKATQTLLLCADGVARTFVVAPEYMQDGQLAPGVEPVQVGEAWVLQAVTA